MVLELFAVVGRDHDPGARPAPQGDETVQETADLLIHEADLAVIPVEQEAAVVVRQRPPGVLELGDRVVCRVERTSVIVRVQRPKPLGRVVRPVRIEVVYEQEDGPARLAPEPGQGRVGDAVGPRLHAGLEPIARFRHAEVLEGPEAARQAERCGDVHVRHEAAGGVAGPPERLGESRDLGSELQTVVLDPVARRIAGRHHRGHRRQRPGRGRPGRIEHGRPPCQPVDAR